MLELVKIFWNVERGCGVYTHDKAGILDISGNRKCIGTNF